MRCYPAVVVARLLQEVLLSSARQVRVVQAPQRTADRAVRRVFQAVVAGATALPEALDQFDAQAALGSKLLV